MIKYTIIMPIYNAFEYLDVNLKFFQNLKRNDVELLIINDGSTDNSLEKIKRYSINNCKIINQKNYGVSYSRNIGIRNAKGKYISFLDCDDTLNEKIFDVMDKYCNGEYDVIRYGFNFFDGNYYKSYKLCNHKIVYTCENIIKLYQETMSTYKHNSIWNQFIKKDILIKKSIFFDKSHNFAEDLEFNLKLFLKLKKMCIITQCLYNYYINPNGITKKFNYDNILKCTNDAIDIYMKNIIIAKNKGFLNETIILHSLNEILTNIKKIFLNKKITNEQIYNFMCIIRNSKKIHDLEQILKEKKISISFVNKKLLFSNSIFILRICKIFGNKKAKGR